MSDERDPLSRVDINKPSSARMYDFYLRGKDNYHADRTAALEVMEINPSASQAAQANRDFLMRSVQWVAGRGVRQFIDIGTGIPTEPNTHQAAQGIRLDARIVYVDNDPLVLAHARALLVGSSEGRIAYIDADLRDPQAILGNATLLKTVDLSQPICLSLLAVMHFISDADRAYEIVRTFVDAAAPGSYLIMSHVADDLNPEMVRRIAAVYSGAGLSPVWRSRDEFARFFADLELVDPGIATVHRWKPPMFHVPEEVQARKDKAFSIWAAVGRKP